MKALEFYSGIGGLHYALNEVVTNSEVVAFDINDLANNVYEHNFGVKPVQTNISTLTPKKLDKWAADIWLLSPPCQPYTRRGLQKHSADARASSFISLLSLISQLKHPPRYLLVENVVGFEASDTRDALADTLAAAGFLMQEFIVTPHQLGIPYSRPRYFALAKRGGSFCLPAPPPVDGPFRQPPSLLLQQQQQQQQQQQADGQQQLPQPCNQACTAQHAQHVMLSARRARQLGEFLVSSPAPELAGGVRAKLPNFVGFKRAAATHGFEVDPKHLPSAADVAPVGVGAGAPAAVRGVPLPARAGEGRCAEVSHRGAAVCSPCGHERTMSGEVMEGGGEGECVGGWEAFKVSDQVMERHGWCFDLVSTDGTSSNCFTKTYGQYIKGSGSILATRNLHLLRQLEGQQAQHDRPDGGQAGDGGMLEEGAVHAEGEEVMGRAHPAEQAQLDGGGGASDVQPSTEADMLKSEVCAPRETHPGAAAAVAPNSLLPSLQQLGLRYFTPREIANLHSFPPEFSFPPSVTLRQRYALLGNSLSVAVVEDLLRYLLMDFCDCQNFAELME